MSPTVPPAFEHLPAEIHGQILRQMASPEDVYSTIRSSPKALGSFLCFREDILIQVLQTYLPSEIFTEYLGLLRTPKYEDFNHVPNRSELSAAVLRDLSAAVSRELPPAVLRDDWQLKKDWFREGCKFQAWAEVIHRFFKDHFARVSEARSLHVPAYTKPKPSEKAEVNYLISTYGMLKRFIRRYHLFVGKNMANTCRHMDFDPQLREAQILEKLEWPPLSEYETFRLHRGFLRYEVCCRLHTITDQKGATLQFRMFGRDFFKQISEYLHDWEEEEIQCIWRYVWMQYRGVARDVVEDFCCDLWRLTRNARHAPDGQITLAPDIVPAAGAEYFGFRSWECDMSCLGLPLLQQVLQSGVDDQRRFVKNTNLRRLPPYWGCPFLRDKPNTHRPWNPRANHIYNSIAPTLSAPAGEGSRTASWWVEDETDVEVGLQETGWVFWEHHTREEYFAVPGRDIQGHHISHYIATVHHRETLAEEGLGRTGIEGRYPLEMMYVTKEDHRELVDKYAAKPVEPDAEHFLLRRLRAISDWSSKEVSPAFQQICSVRHATE